MLNAVAFCRSFRGTVTLLAALVSLVSVGPAQTTTTLVPSSYTTTSGTSGGQVAISRTRTATGTS